MKRASSSNSACGGGDSGPGPSKRALKTKTCIIHCTDDKTDLISVRDLQSWNTLLQAAEIRQHEPILKLVKDLPDDKLPDFSYHRKCRSAFTHKKELKRISECNDSVSDAGEQSTELGQWVFHRRSSSITDRSSRVYEPICIFCEKNKYVKKTNSRELLTKCVELRCDQAIREAATEKNDSRMLAIVSRDLVAAEAHYHRSCYRLYTLKVTHHESTSSSVPTPDVQYAESEKKAFAKLFRYIREDMFERPRVLRLTVLTNMLVTFLKEAGVQNVRQSTKKHIRRTLSSEFRDSLHFVLDDNGKLLVYPENLTFSEIVKENIRLKNELNKKELDSDNILERAALQLRRCIQNHEVTQSWPPLPSDLYSSHTYIPEQLRSFLRCVISGQQSVTSLSPRVQRLIDSVSQDLVYGVTCAKVIPPKHILLPFAVKTLTGNVELIRIINHLGHGISYSKAEEVDTALCLHKLASQREDSIALPENIQPFIFTTVAWDNIDRLEETLSGGGTSHRVNGIVVQHEVYGPKLPSVQVHVPRHKQRSVEVGHCPLPVYNAGERTGPPPRQYVPVDVKDVTNEAFKINLLWIIARLHASENQCVGGWTGFNISIRDKVEVHKDIVGYLPTINAPATEMSTVQEVLVQTKKIMTSLSLQSIILVADQAIYAKVTEILWKHTARFPNIIPRLGAFHTACTLLHIIGKRFQDAGLKDLCIESGVLAEGSVAGVLEGRKYNRGVRFHKLLYEGLMRLAWREFPSWLELHNAHENHHLDVVATEVSEMVQDLHQETSEEVLKHSSFLKVSHLFQEYLEYLRHGSTVLAKFWMSYIDMVDILLNLLRASREGNWNLHLSAIHSLIPWCFAYDHVNYARYLSYYYAEMTNLPHDNPGIYEYLQNGGFSVQRSSTNPFGRIPVDQCVETTINRDTQTHGGTKGFSLKPGALSRYYLTAEYRSSYLRILKDTVHLEQTDLQHNDLKKSRMQRDEHDVRHLVETLDTTWINPFSDGMQELVSISTGRVVSEEIVKDLVDAYKTGLESYKVFREERLEQSTETFHRPLQKKKLKTFTNLAKKDKLCKVGPKDIILKADRNLFAHMIIIAQSRQLQMQEVLGHSLGPVPWALSTPDGSLRKTSKAALALELQKYVAPAENIPRESVCLIDGMALVQRLKGNHKTFAEVAETLLSFVLIEGEHSPRIDVVFDVYLEQSIKNLERTRRGATEGTIFRHITPGHSVQQWRKFLACPFNKESLIQVVVEEWKHAKNREKIAGKDVYVTVKEKCYKITQSGSEEIEELRTTQEEADTRLIFHAKHAAKAGYQCLTIVADDTDVLVLATAFASDIQCQMYQKRGTRARTKYTDITKLAHVLGENNCRALIGLHAFTGCDSVSAFAGRGKVAALKAMKLPQFSAVLQDLGNQWNLTMEQHRELEAFVCHLYQSKAGTRDVNDLRYKLFCAKKGETESWQLPPCAAALHQHSERANYQAGVWKRCLESCPDIPSPAGHGWCIEKVNGKDELTIDWLHDAPPAPEAVLQLLSCTCSRSCKLPTCPCLANGLKCTHLCKLLTCTNQVPEEEPLEENYVDDSDESDDDYWN